jgi:hypothetical protein
MMSENWIKLDGGVYNLYKSTDNNFICQEYEVRPQYSMMLMRSCFIRDLNFIEGELQKYKWCPTLAKEERDGWKIYLRFSGHLCQDIIDRGEPLEDYCPDWKEQLEQMCVDLHKSEIYKLSMYPKCFFIDEDKTLKTFSFFSASRYLEQPINMQLYMPLLNNDRASLVRKLMIGDSLDMKLLNEKAFKEYIKWPGDVLPAIYDRVYLDLK